MTVEVRIAAFLSLFMRTPVLVTGVSARDTSVAAGAVRPIRDGEKAPPPGDGSAS
ncbi:filamentous hemagglutinin family outer membrane protein [Streptomyces laurentii]|uniref:Filamentous hemagglutinin family outer membrane protein n=1 Tax=Streptomyces laurentii TaxID=39478 RepID=A0A170RV63_STRLU|nr:filamentous hemagglutinin family outer membrane protein [Streptomyces laurentii]